MKISTEYLLITYYGDYTSKIIADWLAFYSKSVKIFYTDKFDIELKSILIGNVNSHLMSSQFSQFKSEKHYISFYRGGMVKLSKGTNSRSNPGDFYDFNSRLKYFFTTYEMSQKEIVDNFFTEKYTLGKDNGSRTNKIINLKKAIQIGLKIPNTLLTTNKSDIQEFFKKSKIQKVITKSLDIGLFFGDKKEKKVFQQLTKNVEFEEIESFPETFPLTLFQEQIDKILELRVFYLKGKMWTSAILSQQQENTQVDCRNYDIERMNRVVTYNLPNEIETKLHLFMKSISMDTGSIDILLSKENEYYFLEVNPGGQFTGYSEICNFNLEMEIAKHLIENEK